MLRDYQRDLKASIYAAMSSTLNKTHIGDCRAIMQALQLDGVKVRTCVTSPPYFGLRNYGQAGQIGLEPTPDAYVAELVDVFRAVRDLLTDDGTAWLNLGDSYAAQRGGTEMPAETLAGGQGGKSTDFDAYRGRGFSAKALEGQESAPSRNAPVAHRNARAFGLKHKDLIGIPWRVALALQADGWYLRQDIIWHKPNPMPESVRDRCTKAHEYIFLLAKSEKYYFDSAAMQEPAVGNSPGNKAHKGAAAYAAGDDHLRTQGGLADVAARETRNRRDVWSVPVRPYKGAHFATFPPDLIEPCILAGSAPGDVVLDPFMGSGTTAAVAVKHGRQYVGCELNPEYVTLHAARGL